MICTNVVDVDQTHVLSLRTGQQHVPEVRNVLHGGIPGRVETYGYHGTIHVTVEQNNLHFLIGLMISNSVVPPPPPASAPGHQMEMDTVMEQSRMDEMLAVTLAYVMTEISLPVVQEINVLRRLSCAMENLCVQICMMWSFVASKTMMFVDLIIHTITRNVLPPVHQNIKNVMIHTVI